MDITFLFNEDVIYIFQKTCTHTNPVARIKLVIVLRLIPSPNIHHVKAAITIIPDPKPTNLPGHNKPSKPATMNFVAIIKTYDIGKPNKDIVQGLSLAHVQINCPFT